MLRRIKDEMSTCVDIEKPYCHPSLLLLLFVLSCSSLDGTVKEKCTLNLSARPSVSLFPFLSDTLLKSQTLMGLKAPKDRWAIYSPARLHQSCQRLKGPWHRCTAFRRAAVTVTVLSLPTLPQRSRLWKSWMSTIRTVSVWKAQDAQWM